jgi:hypothetical protein
LQNLLNCKSHKVLLFDLITWQIPGAVCKAGTSVPFIQAGYYRQLDKGSSLSYVCIPPSACNEAGNGSTTCSEAYTGFLCGDCKSGYFRLGKECRKCLNSWAKWIIILISIVILLVVLRKLYKQLEKIPYEIKVALSWFQFLALFPTLSNSWPQAFTPFFNFSKLSNLDIQYFGFDCDLDAIFWTTWTFKLIVPLILFILICVMRLVNNFFLESREKSFPVRRSLFVFTFFLAFFYTSILGSVFEPFNCIYQADGSYYMFASPSLQCFDKKWYSYLPLASVFIFAYIIFFPIISFAFFFKYRHDLENEKFASIFHSLVQPYKKGAEFWEWIKWAFKVLFVLGRDFVYSESSYKKMFNLMVLVIHFLVEVRVRPHKNTAHSRLSSE